MAGGNNLRLQVLLDAVDRVTGPMKKIMGGTNAAAKAMRAAQGELRKLSETQRNIEGFRKLEAQLGDTSGKLVTAQRELRRLGTETHASEGPNAKLTAALKRQATAVGKLRELEARQRAELARSRSTLQAAGISTDRLAIHQRELAANVKRANAQLAEQRNRLQRINQAQAKAQKMTSAGLKAGAVGTGLAFAGQRALRGAVAPVGAAMRFESAMADVRKVVDFDTPEQFQQMAQDVQDLSMRLPMTAEGIAQIVAAAGQAGIARNELLRFAQDAAKMGVAFDSTSEDAGQTMATWRTAFRMTQDQVVQLADQVNHLGNTGPANVGKISDVLTRIGALGEVGGLGSGEVAALGATVAGMGIASEVSATGIKNLILRLTAGEAATKKQRAVFKQLGLDAVGMADAMQHDAAGAIVTVLKRLRELPEARRNAAMSQLFGTESIGAIAPLLTNLDLLEQNFRKVGDAQHYAGSMDAEYAARVATSENALQLLKNTALVLAQSIGETLIPDFKAFAEQTGAVVKRVVAWIRENPVLVKTLAKAAVTGAALVTVLGGLLIAGGMAAMAFGQIHGALAILTGGGGLGALMGQMGTLATRIIPTLLNVGRALMVVLGGISWPVLAIGAAIAVVAALVWKYWGPIKAFMVGLWEGLVEAVAPIGAAMREALAPLAPLWDMLAGAVAKVWNWIKQLFTPFQATNEQLEGATHAGRTVGRILGTVLTGQIQLLIGFLGLLSKGVRATFDGISHFLSGWPTKFLRFGVDMIKGLVSGISSMAGAVKDAVMGTVTGAVDKFKALLGIRSPSRLFAQFGDYTMQGFAGGLMRSHGAPLQAMSALGNRMRQVGAGMAMGAAALPAAAIDHRPPMSASAASPVAGATYNITIHAPVGSQAQDIATLVRAELERIERDRAARTRSRLGDYD